MRTLSTPLVFLALAGTLALALALPATAEDGVTRAYNVAFLARSIEDSPGPGLGLPADETPVQTHPRERDSFGEVLVDLVKANITPDAWTGANTVRLSGNALLVHAPPSTHEKVASLLAWARALHARPVLLELAVYEAPAAQAGAVLAAGPVLDDKARAALDTAPWRRVRASRLAAFSGQRLHLAGRREVRFLKGYDVDIASESAIYTPAVETLSLGSVDDLRPVLSHDGQALLVTCRLTTADAPRQLPTFDTGLKAGEARLAPLDQPAVATRKVRTAVWMPAGSASLVAAQATDGQMRVLVVRHVAAGGEAPAAPRPEGKRALALFDTAFAAYGVWDFPGPRLAPKPQGRQAGAGAVFEDSEPATELSPEGISEMIRGSVDPDSWHNVLNRLSVMRSQILVHQTPAALAKIEELVKKLEKSRRSSVQVRARLLRPSAERSAWLLAQSGQPLAAAAAKQVEELLAVGKELDLVDDQTVVGLPRMRVHAASFTESLHVASYDAQVAQKSSALQPMSRPHQTGTVLDVRATPTGEGQKVLLDLGLQRADLIETRVVSYQGSVKIQLPTVEFRSREAAIVLPAGGAYLVDLPGGLFALIEVRVSQG